MDQAWRWREAHQIGAAIGTGEINPVALTDLYLTAIEQCPESPRIFSVVTYERARREAGDAAERARLGKRLSPLDGVPITWKDNIDSAGDTTEAGSDVLKGRIPQRDAAVLRRATQSGLVCLGKTHMTELAFSGLGINTKRATPPLFGVPDVVPGGSSSGAAASVRYGLAAAAIGTDTGGSIRLPAAWNNLVGFKPDINDLPMMGIVPLAESFDQVGPLARSVTDATLLYQVLSGTAFTLPNKPLSTCRLAILQGAPFEEIEQAPRHAFEQSLDIMRGKGAALESVNWSELQESLAMAGPLTTAEAWANWGTLIEDRPGQISDRIGRRFRKGADVSAADYIRAKRRLAEIRAEIAKRAEPFDALLLPSVAITPPNTDDLQADDALFVQENLKALRNTRIGNMLGGPSLTLPTIHPHCGLMLIQASSETSSMFTVGRAIETAIQTTQA